MGQNLKALALSAATAFSLQAPAQPLQYVDNTETSPDCALRPTLQREAWALLALNKRAHPKDVGRTSTVVRPARDNLHVDIARANEDTLLRGIVVLSASLPGTPASVKALAADTVKLSYTSWGEMTRALLDVPASDPMPSPQRVCEFVREGHLRPAERPRRSLQATARP